MPWKFLFKRIHYLFKPLFFECLDTIMRLPLQVWCIMADNILWIRQSKVQIVRHGVIDLPIFLFSWVDEKSIKFRLFLDGKDWNEKIMSLITLSVCWTSVRSSGPMLWRILQSRQPGCIHRSHLTQIMSWNDDLHMTQRKTAHLHSVTPLSNTSNLSGTKSSSRLYFSHLPNKALKMILACSSGCQWMNTYFPWRCGSTAGRDDKADHVKCSFFAWIRFVLLQFPDYLCGRPTILLPFHRHCRYYTV